MLIVLHHWLPPTKRGLEQQLKDGESPWRLVLQPSEFAETPKILILLLWFITSKYYKIHFLFLTSTTLQRARLFQHLGSLSRHTRVDHFPLAWKRNRAQRLSLTTLVVAKAFIEKSMGPCDKSSDQANLLQPSESSSKLDSGTTCSGVLGDWTWLIHKVMRLNPKLA